MRIASPSSPFHTAMKWSLSRKTKGESKKEYSGVKIEIGRVPNAAMSISPSLSASACSFSPPVEPLA